MLESKVNKNVSNTKANHKNNKEIKWKGDITYKQVLGYLNTSVRFFSIR